MSLQQSVNIIAVEFLLNHDGEYTDDEDRSKVLTMILESYDDVLTAMSELDIPIYSEHNSDGKHLIIKLSTQCLTNLVVLSALLDLENLRKARLNFIQRDVVIQRYVWKYKVNFATILETISQCRSYMIFKHKWRNQNNVSSILRTLFRRITERDDLEVSLTSVVVLNRMILSYLPFSDQVIHSMEDVGNPRIVNGDPETITMNVDNILLNVFSIDVDEMYDVVFNYLISGNIDVLDRMIDIMSRKADQQNGGVCSTVCCLSGAFNDLKQKLITSSNLQGRCGNVIRKYFNLSCSKIISKQCNNTFTMRCSFFLIFFEICEKVLGNRFVEHPSIAMIISRNYNIYIEYAKRRGTQNGTMLFSAEPMVPIYRLSGVF